VTDRAEYDRNFPVHLAVDSDVHTAGVLFQTREHGPDVVVTVFGDYYAYGRSAYENGLAVLSLARRLCSGRVDRATTDPAGRSANAVGPTVLGEYNRAGFRPECWPLTQVADGLALIESFVSVEPPALFVHPRCTHLIEEFANYRRAKRGGQFVDRPEDPQHPYEDVMDSLRGGLVSKFPDGRRSAPKLRKVHAGDVM